MVKGGPSLLRCRTREDVGKRTNQSFIDLLSYGQALELGQNIKRQNKVIRLGRRALQEWSAGVRVSGETSVR